MEFSKKLRQLREESGLSQQEVADKIGVSKSMISFYENGVNEPDKEKRMSLAKLFNVEYSILYDDDKVLSEPIVAYGKKEIKNAPNNTDMVPKKDYDTLNADYQRLLQNYDRLQTHCDRLEKRLERYEADENSPKGNERFG